MYTEKADIYSFALVLYEMVSERGEGEKKRKWMKKERKGRQGEMERITGEER